MKFAVKERNSETVRFVADISCYENVPESEKLWMALDWAFKNNIDTTYLDLRGINMRIMTLDNKDLTGCDFRNSYWPGASMKNTILEWVDLTDSTFPIGGLLIATVKEAKLDNVIFVDDPYNPLPKPQKPKRTSNLLTISNK